MAAYSNPKRESFGNHDQQKVNEILSHINSYSRLVLGNKPSTTLLHPLWGKVLEKLSIHRIPPNDIILTTHLI